MTYDSDHDMSQASPLVHTTEPQIVVAREVHTHPLQDSMERPTTAPLAALSQDRDKLGELLKPPDAIHLGLSENRVYSQ